MGNNNLYKVENTLRSIAKRYKSVKYSLGLAILFLMMGVSAFSEEVAIQENAVPTREEIASSRENLKNSVGSLQSKIDSARAENEKGLAGLKLELVQLMEQGDQVVKSPWASWQFGANYFYSKWNGTYKGRGDKSEKYPFEGVFARSTDVFGRATTARTAAQQSALDEILAASGGLNLSGNGLNYGLISRAQINEDPVAIEVSAGIRPKNIQKGTVTLNVPPVNIVPPRVSTAPTVPTAPAAPNINIPSFSPVAPKVEAPVIPVPPTFAVILGADCNHGCNSSSSTPRKLSSEAFVDAANNSPTKPSLQNERMVLHYTWPAGSGKYGSPDDRASLAFKMYKDESWIRLTDRTGPNPEASQTETKKDIYFNSYNTDHTGYAGTKEFDSVANSGGAGQPEKNHQYFFVGGSRFWEVDNRQDHFVFAAGRKVNLGGILTLGMVSQENNATLENAGTITDVEERDEKWIKEMPYDTSGAGVGKYLSIRGAGYDANNHDGTIYKIKKSTDGYVGYKVGIAQVQENDNQGQNVLLNTGTIDFRGERSIGIYAYIPRHLSANTRSEAKLINRKIINLSGAESYGIKFAAKAGSNVEMTNDVNAVITLRRNPTAQGGNDRADNTTAMALMADSSVVDKVSLATGKAVNKGTINLQDNISNALGMFVNIDSDMTNQGTINISALAQKDNANKYKPNVGMRADQVESSFSTAANFDTKVINDKITGATGKINVTGQGNIAMLASGKNTAGPNGKGTATAVNKGEITIDKGTSIVVANQGKDNYGMLSIKEAHVVNETGGKITIKTAPGSVGMAALKEGTTQHSTAENKGIITVDGAKSTGVYNTGHFLMDNDNAQINVKGTESIGLYSQGTDATHTKTELKRGTVKAEDGGVGLYSDRANITLDNTSNKLNLTAGNGGLLFYNYKSDVPNQYEGKFTLVGKVNANIERGGYGFYLKNATINTTGGVTGVPEFLNDMFTLAAGADKLQVNMKTGGTFMILHKPTGAAMKLSSVDNLGTAALGTKVQLNAPATGSYKVYSVYRGKLEIDKNVNLDKDDTITNPDTFYKVDFRSSVMTLDSGKSMTGTKAGQVALFQGNYNEGTPAETGTVTSVSITNSGTIKLSGNSTGTSTTTAMAGDFITLTNKGNIEVSGNRGVGIYGAGGSKILNDTNGSITVGQEGVALYGANQLKNSTLGDKKISIINRGTLKGVSGKTKSFGIFAENDLTKNPNIADAVLTNANGGTIDFSMSKQSIGIHSYNSTVSNIGAIKMGEGGVAINAKNSNITSSGDITLAGKGIGFNLTNSFGGRTLNFSSKVSLTGDGNSIFNLTNTSFDTTIPAMTDNINLVSNGKGFSYFTLKDSTLVYNKDRSATGNNIVLVNGERSTVDWRSNITLNGQNNVAFYLNGTRGAGPELTIAAGKAITLTGNKSVGAYGINGARIINNANITVGENGAALYSTGTGTLRNTGILTLGKNSVGMYMKDGTDITNANTGQINSTQEGAKGIVINRGTATSYANNGRINLTGTGSIGIHVEGAAHSIQNKNSVIVGDTTGKDQSVAIHLKDGGTFRSLSGTTVKAGNKSIGIYGTTVATTIENNAKVEVGDGGIGIYSKGGNVNLEIGSKMSIGKALGTNQEAVGLYLTGNSGGTVKNNLASFTIGKGSIGIVDAGSGKTTINNNLQSVALAGDSVYTYTSNTKSNVIGNTKITSSGNGNYGYYVAGNLTNNAVGTMDFSSGIGNVGIYSAYTTGNGVARNYANITVGKTDVDNDLYSIGMAAGYTNKDNPSQNRKGHVINLAGSTITVGHDRSIGMYASGAGSIAENDGTIRVTGQKAIGMYLENGATGINTTNGRIIIENSAKESIGVYSSGKDTIFKNYGEIIIKAPESKGIVTANGAENSGLQKGTIVNQDGTGTAESYKKIEATAGGDKPFGDKLISVPKGGLTDTQVKDRATGKILSPAHIDVTTGTNLSVNDPGARARNTNVLDGHKDLSSVSRIGMYVDTSGVNFTNPIQGLQYLSGLKRADLIIGAEAAEYTNEKTITVGKNILARYNKAIESAGLDKWDILSGSLTWAAAPLRMSETSSEIIGVILTKTDYKEYAKNSEVPYNFLDGLEQRYGMNTLDSKEKRLFNKINGIGKTESILLSQAFDEMLGQQYANVQQRIQATGNILDKEFSYLRDEWRTASKDSNKIKTFGTKGEYKTDTAGIKDYKYNAYGVAYVHENEDIKLGKGIGWYTGMVHNTFKFKDIGNSKEEMLQGKVGVFKSVPFDDNNSLNWTISGDIFVGHNKMKRKYLVVDEVFNAKSKYYTYGIGIKNEIGKDIRLSESFSLRPYAALRLEYGRMTKIKEKSGEVRLEVKENDYFSLRPEVGAEVAFKHYFGMKALRTSLGVAYENELGRVANAKNKARVGYTSAGWYDLRGEKEDRKGNVKFDLNVGLDNTRVGVTGNVGYDTKGENLRGGVGLRVIF